MDKLKQDFKQYYSSSKLLFEQDYHDVKRFVEGIINKEMTWLDLLNYYPVDLKYDRNHALKKLHGMTRTSKERSEIWINPEWVYRYANQLGLSKAYKMHLIHELYHVCEYDLQPFYLKYNQERKLACSEMAANMYVINILGCRIHPIKIEENIILNEKNYHELSIIGADVSGFTNEYEC